MIIKCLQLKLSSNLTTIGRIHNYNYLYEQYLGL